MPILFDNRQDAAEVLLKELKCKYQQEFEIVNKEKYKHLGICDFYSCVIRPKENETQHFFARIMAFGEVIDDYGVYLYKEELEREARDILEQQPYIIKYEVQCKLPATSMQWKNVPVEEFRIKSGVRNRIVVELEQSNTIMVEWQIEAIVHACEAISIDTELLIVYDEQTQYYQTISGKLTREGNPV